MRAASDQGAASARPRSGPRSVVLAGGGTAGHVNPLLAVADCLRRRDPSTRITALGTSDGLEVRLVAERGYPLRTVARAPFPRRPDLAALRFPRRFSGALRETRQLLREVGADVVVGFGGYVATPAYLAARAAGVPYVVHEANARPGLANRLGARGAAAVATTFPSTRLPGAQVIGMPMRQEITRLDRTDRAVRAEALRHLGLEDHRPTLLVFGGSLGARVLNAAVAGAAGDLIDAGVQVLQVTGEAAAGSAGGPRTDTRGGARHVQVPYLERMDLAYAAADLVLARAGSGTVNEVAALGVPAVLVPLPIGNGEQRLNAADLVAAGGALVVEDADLDADRVRSTVIPLAGDVEQLAQMSRAARGFGHRDADERLADLVLAAARTSGGGGA